MTLVELKQILDKTELPVAYSHFGTPPQLPYICYLVDNNPNFKADDKVYYKISDVNIELYTSKKDLNTEKKIEQVLDDNHIPYDSFETYIESEDVFQKTYEVRLI